MEETGILENPALLSLVLPAFEPGRIKWKIWSVFRVLKHPYTGVLGRAENGLAGAPSRANEMSRAVSGDTKTDPPGDTKTDPLVYV